MLCYNLQILTVSARRTFHTDLRNSDAVGVQTDATFDVFLLYAARVLATVEHTTKVKSVPGIGVNFPENRDMCP